MSSFFFPFVAMISLSGRIHLSFPPAALEGRGGLQGGHLTFKTFHRQDGGVGRDWTRLIGGVRVDGEG